MTKSTGIEIGAVEGMARYLPSNRFIAVVALLVVCGAPVAAWSQDQQGFAKVGGYGGASFVPAFTLDGESFDGLTYYQEIDGEEISILPKLDKQKMFRGILGYRGEKAALEFSYERTNHNGTFGEGGSGTATFQQVNADVRFFFLTHSRFQPYFMVGGGFPWLTVKNGSFLESEPEVGADGTFNGYALNTEVGVTVYPHPQVGIVLGYSYRPIWFDRASGISDTRFDLRPRFRESSKGIVFTTLYTF